MKAKIEQLAKYSLTVEQIPVEITIYRSSEEFTPIYHIDLLNISDTTQLIIEKIRDEIISEVSFGLTKKGVQLNEEEIKKHFKERVLELLKAYFPNLDQGTIDLLANYIVLTSMGLGDLEFLLKDEYLEEVVVNNASEPVWVYHKKFGWLKTNIKIKDENKIRHFSTIIARDVNREITTLNPLLDARLKSGYRINATLNPISSKGNTITVRRFSEKPWTIADFLEFGTIDYESAALIWLAMQYELSVLVVGGTGSGKTSMLNVLANFFPPNQRIVSIEDTRELTLPNSLHWVPMETRQPNPEGKGEITMLDLVVNSLRMRPDRIIVGEIRRQREAEVLFEAMHTGHSTYATLHARDVEEAVARLTNPPINIPKLMLPSLSLILVQYRNRRTGLRRTFQIAEVLSDGNPNLLLQYNLQKNAMEKANKSVSTMKSLKLYTGFTDEQINADIKEKISILQWLVKSKIRDVNQVGLMMADYYMDKEKLISRIKMAK